MHYVKHFNINGVDTRQSACIELQGRPNAATEGYVGVLGIDVTSPTHEVYKCVAVNGSIFTWELLASGLSIMGASVSGSGASTAEFPYDKLLVPSSYVVKVGDLILDGSGFLYSVTALQSTYCIARYCELSLMSPDMANYYTKKQVDDKISEAITDTLNSEV